MWTAAAAALRRPRRWRGRCGWAAGGPGGRAWPWAGRRGWSTLVSGACWRPDTPSHTHGARRSCARACARHARGVRPLLATLRACLSIHAGRRPLVDPLAHTKDAGNQRHRVPVCAALPPGAQRGRLPAHLRRRRQLREPCRWGDAQFYDWTSRSCGVVRRLCLGKSACCRHRARGWLRRASLWRCSSSRCCSWSRSR